MNTKITLSTILSVLFFNASILNAQELMDPKETEVWEPVPKIVEPGEYGQPPSDAIVLFDGSDLSEWTDKNGDEAKWNINNNALTVVPGSGDITTLKSFGDCQLHIEWKAPEHIVGKGQGRGNSGIFLMGLYELQVLDSYNNMTYPNGQAGSIYKRHIPMVNACRPPGVWQSYDIIFKAPKFHDNGELKSAAYITVIHNGVLIHHHTEIKGPTAFIGKPPYKSHPDKLPLLLQDHGNPVSYRNIWIREY